MTRRGITRSTTIAITIATTALFGLVGVRAAGATTLLDVSPSTGLTDGQSVTITLTGVVPGAFSSLQLAECGNAYADGTPLLSAPANAENCQQGIAFVNQGSLTTDPLVFPDVPIRQQAIGAGNRSCVSMPPATFPCYVYVSTSVNQPAFPSVPISFADNPVSPEPTATTTTVTPLGSPIGTDKIGHAAVRVTADEDPTMIPEGSVDVFEGDQLLASAALVAGAANITVGSLGLGAHPLVAHFNGNGSFAASDSDPAVMNVISANNITIGDVSVVEGDSGTRSVIFPVVLSEPSPTNLVIPYTVSGSGAFPATAGVDFVAVSPKAKLTYKALKQVVHFITVKVNGDTVPEPDETFSVTLGNPTTGNFAFRRAVGTATIYDDDTPTSSAVPTLGIGAAMMPEGDAGGPRISTLPVTLSQPVTTGNVSVTVVISSITATHGTRISGADWSGAIQRTLLFKPGVVLKPLTISVFPDLVDEPDEYVSARITSVVAPLGTTVAIGPHAQATGTILSDE